MNTFNLYTSDKPEKKYYVQFINPKTGRQKKIYFGASNYQHYSEHLDPKRRDRYIERHSKRENWKDPYSGAGYWSRWLLWSEKSLKKSIEKTEKKFKINIIDRTNKKGGKFEEEKHSAYKSMKRRKLNKLIDKSKSQELINWSLERWQNLTAKITDPKKFYNCGTKAPNQIKKGLPSVCRPTKKINNKTPILASSFSLAQIKKAIKQKQLGHRIDWYNL